MHWKDNTIFVTGGGSGIGRGLAEALYRKGNKVIIAGRQAQRLKEVVMANPGMEWVELDIQDPKSISAVASRLMSEHPTLNVLINNAGVMHLDDVSGPVDEELLNTTITTNLLGPIRMTSALVDRLSRKTHGAIINTSSVLGFIPLATTALYSAAKAALHSYTLSLRYKLKHTPLQVIELAPPWVQTDLLGSNHEPRAMPLEEFITQAMTILEAGDDEIIVRSAQRIRGAVGLSDGAFTFELNDQLNRGAALV